MRRGPGGGLVVTLPTVESLMDAVAVYLFYVESTIDDVFEARLVLEELASELAPARLTELDVEVLREQLERERSGQVEDYRELHALIAAFSRNPAVEFFVDVFNRVSLLFLDDRSLLDGPTVNASSHAHVAITDAVLAGDEGLTRHRMRKHLQAEATFLRDRVNSRIGLPKATSKEKRGQRVAFAILSDIAADGWSVGSLVGSERELMERYDSSRAVLREAVRVLEHHQVARMRRGPGGGLFVTEPGMEAITEAVALHMHRLEITPAHLFEVRAAVELAVLERGMGRIDDGIAEDLEAALEAERTATFDQLRDRAHTVHALLATTSGNRVLELLQMILLRLTRLHQGPTPRRTLTPERAAELAEVHAGIVEAVVDGDVEVARMRMRKHLEELAAFFA